jgi:hypothetical protein
LRTTFFSASPSLVLVAGEVAVVAVAGHAGHLRMVSSCVATGRIWSAASGFSRIELLVSCCRAPLGELIEDIEDPWRTALARGMSSPRR